MALDLAQVAAPGHTAVLTMEIQRGVVGDLTSFPQLAEAAERVGVVPNAVFSCGAVLRDDTLFVYYGGADTVVCVAKVSLKKLLKILLPDNL